MNMKIVEITEKLYKQEIDPNEAERLLLDLFAVSGSALHEKVVKQIPDEYKEQISKTIKKHYC